MSKVEVTAEQIAAFRLNRHHLQHRRERHLVEVCRSVCGMQAQVMSSAELGFLVRMESLDRAEIRNALWQQRSLVKTSLMRQTLHIIPSDEFFLYISALKTSLLSRAFRYMTKFGLNAKDIDATNRIIMDQLAKGPIGRAQLVANLQQQSGKRVQRWMANVWSPLRVVVAEGLVCYGPGEKNEIAFIRVDQWLSHSEPVDEFTARQTLLRKYLAFYGPVSLRDFSHWSGLTMKEVREFCEEVQEDCMEVSWKGQPALLLKKDLDELRNSSLDTEIVRLLPGFDPYLLGHAGKHHLVHLDHYKKIYRAQGWISPVVLLNGHAIGVWSHKRNGGSLQFQINSFGKISSRIKNGMKKEAARMARFLEMPFELMIS